MRSSPNWFHNVRRKFRSPSRKTGVVILHSNVCSSPDDARTSGVTDETASCEELVSETSLSLGSEITREDIAARKIQAAFRGHLARRAFRALRSMVKLQALARGAYVRKQSRIALHCMHALVRLQVRIRARQLLGRCSDD
ncbi:protein IQ-DOMAIN 20 [Mercurialis annua]|uniref:protein IQ-DOMAIN 20 n=1 Tax=Mercurialis annua TaxID=3986 RepID=UPI00215F59F2|nr:protein IQ-DOMAIN 20 [Mercurialis annua]